MTLVIKAQEVLFSSSGNVHSTPLNDKSQEVLELINPITLGFYGNTDIGESSPTKPHIQQGYCKKYEVKL